MADTILDKFTTVDLGFPELAARPPQLGGAGPDDSDNVLGIAETRASFRQVSSARSVSILFGYS